MDLKDIKKIVEMMGEHGLTQFKLEQDDSKLELSKKSEVDIDTIQQLMAMAPASPAPAAAPAQAPALAAPAPAPAVSGGEDEASDSPPAGEVAITAELVGTFYRSPGPEEEPFVQTGSEIEENSAVCIIEAMKVMNEIQAGVRGTITKVLVESGTPVQFGETLFHVKPA